MLNFYMFFEAFKAFSTGKQAERERCSGGHSLNSLYLVLLFDPPVSPSELLFNKYIAELNLLCLRCLHLGPAPVSSVSVVSVVYILHH